MSNSSRETLDLRKLLLALIAITIAGTVTELLLLGHTETLVQWLPLAAFGTAAAAWLGVVVRPGRSTLRAFQIVMAACTLVGLAGLYFHFRGNIEFARETYPSLKGRKLVWEALTGATPTLAPGAMVQFGLLGLAFTWRHPRLVKPADRATDPRAGDEA